MFVRTTWDVRREPRDVLGQEYGRTQYQRIPVHVVTVWSEAVSSAVTTQGEDKFRSWAERNTRRVWFNSLRDTREKTLFGRENIPHRTETLNSVVDDIGWN